MEDNSLRRGVISLYHDSITAGHPGISKTLWSISRDYWWPGMKNTITNYVKGCTTCQSCKNNPTNPKPSLFPITTDPHAYPFETITLDFITKLPKSQGYDTILMITDHDCSKASIFIPCHETITTEQTALLYGRGCRCSHIVASLTVLNISYFLCNKHSNDANPYEPVTPQYQVWYCCGYGKSNPYLYPQEL